MPESAVLLDGRHLVDELRVQLVHRAAERREELGRPVRIALIAVGDDPTAALYAGQVTRSCLRTGLDCLLRSFPAVASEDMLRKAVKAIGRDKTIDGVVVLLPLPRHIRPRVVTEVLPPEKDIDGLGPGNAGRLMVGFPSFVPSTAEAALELLRHTGIPLQGQNAVVVGRGVAGGKPAALLFLRENATVTLCHSRTRDLASITRQADVLFTSVGRHHCLSGDMIKPGAVVLDAGMNSLDGKLVGDVDFASVRTVASYVTPVPGGIGPLTNLMLIRHALVGPS
jgi:methylenetetrahydrofolate dehydrogenase (NADP+) / methenyltetrahydrofolate cyclohydrolase